jgi:enoyl-[acyl-carrier protein] reductase I
MAEERAKTGERIMSTGLMAGKRGLIMGVANDHSIAWGIAKRLAQHGAELAFTYQTPALGKRVRPLANSLGSDFILPCEVALKCDADDPASIDSMLGAVARRWGTMDFLVHAVAFSDKNELRGRYADTTRENFLRTMVISCFSFTELARRAAKLMPRGSAMLTLTYGGSTRVMPNYNVMGVAKAALEASVRYLAVDFGGDDIRVNAISAGPVRTLAGSGVSDARLMFNYQKRNAPLRRTVAIEEIGNTALYLLSDLSSGVTGEIHFVDSGYNIIAMPRIDELKAEEASVEDPGSQAAE